MGLLHFLFGGGHPDPQAAPPPHQFGYDPSGYLTPQMNGGGAPEASPPPQAPAPGSLVSQVAQQAPAAPANQPPPQAPPQAPQDPNSPITVSAPSGDTWKPHKAGILGQIADYLLDTHFGKENVRRNMAGALEHINSDPQEAVRRMAMVDPQEAEKLYTSVTREMHQTAMEKHQNDVYGNMAENQAMTVARNMATLATPENAPAVSARITQFLQAKGVNQSLIDTIPAPDGSPDDFKMFAQGGVPVGKQISVNEQVRNHGVQHQDRVAGQGIQRERNQIMREQGSQRIGIAEQNSEIARTNSGIAQQNADTAASRAAVYAKLNGGQPVQKAPDGSALVPDKTGSTAVRFMKDGRKALYVRAQDGHHWVFSHQMIGRDEKAKGVIDPNVDDNANEN